MDQWSGKCPMSHPSRAFLSACLFVVGAAAQAQDNSKLPSLPSTDAYVDYLQFVQSFPSSLSDSAELWSWDPFSELFEAKRYEAAYSLARALRTVPDKRYRLEGNFRNSINLAYEAGNFELISRLIQLDRTLVSLADESAESTGQEPLAVAVAHNDIVWCDTFLAAGADINTDKVKSSKEGGYPANLLTISPTKEMTVFLLGKNIRTTFELDTPQEGMCNDDNVRLRSGPGLTGDVVGKMMKNNTCSVLATTYQRDNINSNTSCWLKVSFKGKVAWVFQPFIVCNYFDLP